jgi:hypothetical protein
MPVVLYILTIALVLSVFNIEEEEVILLSILILKDPNYSADDVEILLGANILTA